MKRKWKKILSASLAIGIAGSTSLVFGLYYNATKSQKYVSESFDNTNNKNEQDPEFNDEAIMNLVNEPKEFFNLSSSQYYDILKLPTSNSNYNDFLLNSKTLLLNKINSIYQEFDLNNLKQDILYFIKKLYLNLNKNASFEILKQEFSINKQSLKINAHFEINIKNLTSEKIILKINDNNYYLEPEKNEILKIDINDQDFNFILTNTYNDFYLNWNTNMVLTFQNKILNINNYCFTKNHFSYAIPIKVEGIVSGKNYYDIVNNDNYYQNLSSDFIKQNIQNDFVSKINLSKIIIKNATSILKTIGNNASLETLLNTNAENIVEIIKNLLSIPNEYNDLLIDAVSSNKPIFEILTTKKNQIASLISYLINDSLITPETILNFLNPFDINMSESDLNKEIQSLKELLLNFLPSIIPDLNIDFIDELFAKIFDRKSTILNLFDFLLVQKKLDFINIVSSLNKKEPRIEMIIDLFSLIAKNDGKTPLLTAIASDESKDLIKNIITLTLSPTSGDNSLLLDVLDQLVSSKNPNLNQQTLQNLINVTIVPIFEYFSNDTNYNIVHKFKNFEYNNRKVSYLYNLSIEFNVNQKIYLEPILNILPSSLIINDNNIPIDFIIKNIFKDANNKTLELEIGVNDKLNLDFVANNDDIYLSPIKKNGVYIASYSVPYTLNLKIDTPHLFNSLTSFYKTGVIHPINNAVFNFLIQFLQDFVIRTHTFYGTFSLNDDNTLIDNYASNTYVENNYFKWNDYNLDFNNEILQNITLEDSNAQMVTKVIDNIWVQKTEKINIIGKRPVINDTTFIEKMISTLFSYQSDVKPIIKINPIIKSTLKLSISGINIANINVNLISVNVWFPINILDLSDPNNPKLANYFTLELSI